MSKTPDTLDAETGLSLKVIKAMLAESLTSKAAGLGVTINDQAEHRTFFDNVIARGRARLASRQRDRDR